jgi:hypothetical protein
MRTKDVAVLATFIGRCGIRMDGERKVSESELFEALEALRVLAEAELERWKEREKMKPGAPPELLRRRRIRSGTA